MSFEKILNNLIYKIKNNYTFKSIIVTCLIILLLFLPVGILLDRHYKKGLLNTKREKVKSELENYSILLAREINQKFALLKALEVFTKENWNRKISESEFKSFAYGLYSSTTGIRNLVIAPDGINKYVYPIKGNEETLGHNLIKDKRPEVRVAVQKTINNREFVASGPYELRQGGQGIILRKALYKNNEFWGLVTMAVSMEPIYEYMKLENKRSNINIILRRKNKIFFGENNIVDKEPVTSTLRFKGGELTIIGVPNKSWYNLIQYDLKMFRINLLSIIGLLTIIIHRLSYKNFKIKSIVEAKTRDLKEMNSILREKEKIIKKEKDKIEYQSYHDRLTGLYNRRYFEKKIKELDIQNKIPMSIIIVDVNGLKIVNDNYGHQKGDELLIKTAKLLKNNIRKKDILVRHGGDEFAILLPETSNSKAQTIMNAIQNKCQETKDADLVVSLALGLATKKFQSENVNAIIKEADNNMYQNKISNSRNRK